MLTDIEILKHVVVKTNGVEYLNSFSPNGLNGPHYCGLQIRSDLVPSVCVKLGAEGFDSSLVMKTISLGTNTILYFPDLEDDGEIDDGTLEEGFNPYGNRLWEP
jgi:hypothetical protein